MSNNDNSNRFDTEQQGGVTRAFVVGNNLTIGQQVSLPGAGASSDGVHRGAVTHSVGTGQVKQHEVIRGSSAGLIDSSNILGTYRTPFGSPSGDINESGTIALDPSNPEGMRTSVKAALGMGLIKRGPGGTFVNAFEGTPTTEQVNERVLGKDEPIVDTQERFPAEVQTAFDQRIAPLEQGTYDAVLANGTTHLADGMAFDDVVAAMGDRLARDAGGSPDEHRETARMAVTAFSAQAATAVAAAGVPVNAQEAMYDWFRNTPNGKAELQHALTQLTAARSTAAFTSLTQKFLANAAPSASRLQAEGFKVRGNGENAEVQGDDGAWRLVSSMRFEATKR